jgi:chlorite dismutase
MNVPTKKKTNKTIENKEKEMEKQVKNVEKVVKALRENEKNKRKQQMEKQKRQKIINEKADTIREALKEQLTNQNKFGEQFDDMIEDYIFLVSLKEELQYDIKIKGLRYSSMTGNGYTTDKPNESVQNLLKVNGQMLKILQELDLKAPEEEGEGDDLL